jgi:cbb3-type cytochrome oxidase maturation protein
MNGIGILIPIALLLGLGGLAAFFWSLSHAQFEDLDGAALRILIDDPEKKEEEG